VVGGGGAVGAGGVTPAQAERRVATSRGGRSFDMVRETTD
jgi:hypothetical protein